MDSLKTLIDRQQYDLVIKLTDNATKASDLFYRIAAFTFLGKYEEALFVVQDHQNELEKENLNSLINIHIELLCSLSRFEQAYSALDYYSNLPYQSQIVEETLRKMPEVISKEEKKKTIVNTKNEEELFDLLNSNNPEEVLFGLDLVKKLDVFTYLDVISKILKENDKQTVRSFALMLLVQKEVDRDLDFLSYQGMIKVNPKHIAPPFTGEGFNQIVRNIDHDFKNATLSQNGAQLLSNLAIYIYPFQFKNDEKEITAAIYLYSKALFKEEINIDEYALEHSLFPDKIREYYSLIEVAINDL